MKCNFISNEPHSLISQYHTTPCDYHLFTGLNQNLDTRILKDDKMIAVWKRL